MGKNPDSDTAPVAGELGSQARRTFLKGLAVAAGAGASGAAVGAWGGNTFSDTFADFFQEHYQRMSEQEIRDTVARIERKAQRRYGVQIECANTPPQEGVIFGYAINISKCRGYRDCVHACVEENNLSRDTQYIRVIEMDRNTTDLRHGDHYYDHAEVPVRRQVLSADAMHAL